MVRRFVFKRAKTGYHHYTPTKIDCLEKILFSCQDTMYYVDTISRQTHSFAIEKPCHGNPAFIIALESDCYDFYLLTAGKQGPPCHFKRSEIPNTIQINALSAHTAICFTNVWKNFIELNFINNDCRRKDSCSE